MIFNIDAATPQPSTSKVVETKIVENERKVVEIKEQDTKTKAGMKKKQNIKTKVGIKKKQDTKTKVGKKKQRETKIKVGKKKQQDTKTDTPIKGDIDIVENPPVSYKSTRTYVKNRSKQVPITFEEDIKQDTETNIDVNKKVIIKTETPSKGEIDIVENPPASYKSTRSYVRNNSKPPPFAFEEHIMTDIKTEPVITEIGVEPKTEIKIETEASVDRDEMQIFANTVALQLNNLPFDVAVNVQVKIQNLIVDESINYFNSINSGKQ